VALGSNLGNREQELRLGFDALARVLDRFRTSSIYETEPLHVTNQPRFLNACATGVTRLTPRQLLSHLQDAERAAGRRRGPERYGPRTLDLDLLIYGGHVIDQAGLVVPHPGLRERAFVLVPLAEIASDWLVPASHGWPEETVAALAARAGRGGVVRMPEERRRGGA
jgi:2-amino-4-hydroxy-6-hydroxymethyldihydropteridine diphosphokinase